MQLQVAPTWVVDTHRPKSRSIIATTQPGLFASVLGSEVGHSVSIFSSGVAALNAMRAGDCTDFYADFRQLEDRWTGLRFVRYIRRRPQYDHVRVWLMAEHWPQGQEKWAQRCGAAGMLKRSPRVLAQRILRETMQLPISLELELDDIDSVFYRFAGPMRGMYVESARDALNLGWIAPNAEAYIDRLASTLPEIARRTAFLDALDAFREAARKRKAQARRELRTWTRGFNRAIQSVAGVLRQPFIALREPPRHGESRFFVSSIIAGLIKWQPPRQLHLPAPSSAKPRRIAH